MSVEDDVKSLQQAYNQSTDKDKLYKDLLEDYKVAKQRIVELEKDLEDKSSKLPSKDEVEAMAGMLDLVSKLDESTIEKLSKFGGKK